MSPAPPPPSEGAAPPARSAAVERVWARVSDDPRRSLEELLDPSDLHSLLMEVSRVRASAVTPSRLMQRWANDRFVQPSPHDPRRTWRIESRMWEMLPDDFDGIELSPVTPLASCSAVALVDQDRVISTGRGTEVVSDPTNVLALEAARRRKLDPTRPVHLAACHRVVRAQPFHGPGMFQHFRLFALVSSDRDRGSGSTEAEMLIRHLQFWIRALTDIAPGHSVTAEFSPFDTPVLQERFDDTVLPALQPVPHQVRVNTDPTRERARAYYSLGAIRIEAGPAEIGDGGFTDWTATLMGDRKERCFISCASTERLSALLAAPAAPAAPELSSP